MKSLFETTLSYSTGGDYIITHWGEGTEFDAVSRINYDVETERWEGFLVFKDERFSPLSHNLAMFQLQYWTPGAGNGLLAEQRAGELWTTLVKIFEGLMRGNRPTPEDVKPMDHVTPLQRAKYVLETTPIREHDAHLRRVTTALAALVESLELTEDERLLVDDVDAAPGAVEAHEAFGMVELVWRLVGKR